MKRFLLLLVMIFVGGARGQELSAPDQLAQWKKWVLYDHPNVYCPRISGSGRYACRWYGPVSLTVLSNRLVFQFTVNADIKGWIPLPGEKGLWPERVKVNGVKAPIITHAGLPSVYAGGKGLKVTGEIRWHSSPQYIPLPTEYPLIKLLVSEGAKKKVSIDHTSKLWLVQQESRLETAQDLLEVSVFRKLEDSIPKRLKTRVLVNISGKEREVVIGQIQPQGWTLVNLKSDFPAAIDDFGNLKAQVRSGRWLVSADFRQSDSSDLFRYKNIASNWPDTEIWVVESRPMLRKIEIEGLALDPSQTMLPQNWRRFPTYALTKNQDIQLNEITQAEEGGAKNTLKAEVFLWLTFDQSRWLMQEKVSGQVEHGWRLDYDYRYDLEHVKVDGKPRMVTRRSHASGMLLSSVTQSALGQGVELRKSNLNMSSLSSVPMRRDRIEFELPVSGWLQNDNTRFEQVRTQVQLPPGWMALLAEGADQSWGTWWDNWTLWEIFVWLFVSAALWKSIGPIAGLISLLALSFAFHQPNAPIYVWLAALLPSVLLGFVVSERWKSVLSSIRWLGVFALLLVSVNYFAQQCRLILYPQLEVAGASTGSGFTTPFTSSQTAVRRKTPRPDATDFYRQKSDLAQQESIAVTSEPEMVMEAAPVPEEVSKGSLSPKTLLQPQKSNNVLTSQYRELQQPVPTGPGIPQWKGKKLTLDWQGVSGAETNVKLYLLDIENTRLLRGAHLCLLILMLFYVVIRAGRKPDQRSKKAIGNTVDEAPGVRVMPTLVLLAVVAFTLTPAHVKADSYPSQEMLEIYKKRLLDGPECRPYCADVNQAYLQLTPSSLKITLTYGAVEDVAIPIPDWNGLWIPTRVSMDGKEAKLLAHGDRNSEIPSTWLVKLPKGLHTVVIEGGVENIEQLIVRFPMIPKSVDLEIEGWKATGFKRRVPLSTQELVEAGGGEVGGANYNGQQVSHYKVQLVGSELSFTRLEGLQENKASSRLLPKAAPKFFEVSREIFISKQWTVITRVERVAPHVGAIGLKLPLLHGERPILDEANRTQVSLQENTGLVNITMGEGTRVVYFRSFLKPSEEILLLSESSEDWFESWKVTLDENWWVTYSGLEPFRLKDGVHYSPQWKPKTGEKVLLSIGQLEPKIGATISIDQATLTNRLGQKSHRYDLKLNIRASQGQRFTFPLPEGAELISLTHNGVSQSISNKSEIVDFVVGYGSQTLNVSWDVKQTTRSWRYDIPALELPTEVSNIYLQMDLKKSLWPLWVSGPMHGPAILYWGVLFVALCVALILGWHKKNPLGYLSWIVLAAGATLGWIQGLLVLVVWFYFFNIYPNLAASGNRFIRFSWVVVAILLTLGAIAWVVSSIPQGLVGQPVDYVEGNGSSITQLRWFQDYNARQLPSASVYAVPTLYYRILALVWSLWLGFAMLSWLRWAWEQFTFARSVNEDGKQRGGQEQESYGNDNNGNSHDICTDRSDKSDHTESNSSSQSTDTLTPAGLVGTNLDDDDESAKLASKLIDETKLKPKDPNDKA